MPDTAGALQRKAGIVLVGALVAVLAAVLVRCAWVCDDAYISFRTVDNLVNGHGLVWNTGERVQAFTNPLWVLLLSAAYAITGEIYYTAIAVSILLTLAAALVVVRAVGVSTRAAALALLLLVCSKAFVDYSTSGLENPLTHLLLAVFLAIHFRRPAGPRTLFALSLVAALSAVNRLDTILLYLPVLVAAYGAGPKRRGALVVLAGFAPLLAWEAFSVIYYGFPFPNTYYSKLHSGLAPGELAQQGLLYLVDSLDVDPVTLVAVAAAAVAAIGQRAASLYGPLSGAGLYLVYVVWIGGDFMSGRFLAAPFLIAVAALARLELPARGLPALAPFALAAALGLVPSRAPLRSDATYGLAALPGTVITARGIADERGYYYQATGLLQATRDKEMPDQVWYAQGLRLRATGAKMEQRGAIGFAGFAAGPGVHILDSYGLADPLLARLRVGPIGEDRIGHFERRVPDGYYRTLESGVSSIADRSLAEYHDLLRRIVAGPIWSAERFALIAEFNLGRYDHLLDEYLANLPGTPRIGYQDASAAKRQGTPWNMPGNHVLREDGIVISFPEATTCQRLEVSLDHNDDYELTFAKDGAPIGVLEVPRRIIREQGLRVDAIVAPEEAARAGYDEIRLRPVAGDASYSLGHLRLLCAP